MGIIFLCLSKISIISLFQLTRVTDYCMDAYMCHTQQDAIQGIYAYQIDILDNSYTLYNKFPNLE